MKYHLLIFLILIVHQAKSSDIQHRGIEVTGKAEIYAVPDIFTVKFRFSERGISASKMMSIIDNRSQSLVNACLKLGIASVDIQSAQISLHPIYTQSSIRLEGVEVNKKFSSGERGKIHVSEGGKRNLRQKTSIEANRYLTVKLIDISNYDRLLDIAIKLGVDQISPVEMSFSQLDHLYQQALEEAIFNAKTKAKRLAKKAGVEMGQMISLKEMNQSLMHTSVMIDTSAENVSSQAGQKTVLAQVLVTFSLEP